MLAGENVDFFIFDLGNVIIDIDYLHTFQLLKSQLPEALHGRVDVFYQTDFHKAYEKGEIDSRTFRDQVRAYFDQPWSDQKIDEIWNSLLGKIPSYRIDLIRKLKETHQVGVLSNTNEIHIDAVNQILKSEFGLNQFHDLFDQVYYSHEMGLAKPSEEIYLELVQRLNVPAHRVVFFDDLEANVAGAKKVGINAIQVTGPHVLLEYFNYV